MTDQGVHLTVIESKKPRMSYIGLLAGLAVLTGAGTGKEKLLPVTILKWDSLEENSWETSLRCTPSSRH